MQKTLKVFFTHFYTILSIALFVLSYGAIKVSAIYYPTDNITNPTCAPGASGCYVSLLPDQTSNSGSLLFTNGTNPSWSSPSALSWDSVNGRLGVGTSTPTQAIDIVKNQAAFIALNTYVNSASSAGIAIRKARGTIDLPSVPLNNDIIAGLYFDTWNAGNFYNSAFIQVRADGEFGTAGDTTDNPGRLIFATTPDGSGTAVERMRITNSGNVGIGTTSPFGKLDVAGSSSSTDLVAFDTNRSISVINTNTTTNNAQGIALRSYGTDGTTIQSGVKLLAVNTARTATTITSDLAILTNNAGTISEKMRVRADGKVSIGTGNVYNTDSTTLLNVYGSVGVIRANAAASVFVGRTQSGGLPVSSGTLGSLGAGLFDGTNWNASGNRFAFFAAENWTNSTQGTWMRYYSTPIGSTSANTILEVTPSGQFNFGTNVLYPTLTETSRLMVNGLGSTSSTFTAQFHNSTGTSNSLVVRDDGNVGIGTISPTAKLTVVGGAIMPAIGNSSSAGILFPTDPGGGSGDEAYIRYYVKTLEDTRLIIGNNNDAADDIQINTQSLLVSYLNSCGGVQTNANGAMSCTSDERLKDVQNDFTKGLESIRNINPKAFSWKQNSNMYDNGVVYNGFIAQNIQSALPEAVTLSSDGIHLQVSQLTLLAASINAIKELDIKVNQFSLLNSEINGSFGYLANELLGDINNKIDTIFAKKVKTEELCIKDTCVTEDQLKALLNNAQINQIPQVQPEPQAPDTVIPPADTPPDNTQNEIPVE